jgi:hypothetical protein
MPTVTRIHCMHGLAPINSGFVEVAAKDLIMVRGMIRRMGQGLCGGRFRGWCRIRWRCDCWLGISWLVRLWWWTGTARPIS